LPKHNFDNSTTVDQLALLKAKLGQSLTSENADESGPAVAPTIKDGIVLDIEPARETHDHSLKAVPGPEFQEPRETHGTSDMPLSLDNALIRVPLESIVVGGVNARREFSEDRMTELRESIQVDGLLQPVVVVPEPGQPGQWHLLAGERRFRVVRDLGWEEIPVRVVIIPRNKWRRIMMQENLQQESFSLAEQIRGVVDMMEDDGYSIPEIVAELHLDKGYVYGLFRLYKNPHLRRAIEDGLINGKKILKPLNRLITNEGDERHPGVVERILQFIATKNPSVSQVDDKITDLINALDQAPDVGRSAPRQRIAGSIWEKERQRIQTLVSKSVRNLERDAIRELAKVYQSTAEDLTRLAEE